jgi:hypothetical protein
MREVVGTLLVTSDPRPRSPEWIMLGSDYDVALGISPVNLTTAANTGARQYMGNLDYVTVLFVGGAGAAAEPPVLTAKQHTLSVGGTTADLAVITEFWTKSETTLDNDEQWVRSTQAAGAVVTGTAQVEQMIAFVLRPTDLAAGNKYVSVNVADVGVAAQLGCVLYVLSGVSPRTVPVGMPMGLR